MLGEVYQLVNLHGLEIGMYLKSQYQCGCYLSAGCIDRSPLLSVGFSRSLLECIESCTYVTCELSLTRYIVCGYAVTTNTLRSYRTQGSELRRIPALYHIPLDQPLSEHDLCLALIAYAQSHKPTTLPQFVSAVANWSQREWKRPLPRGRRYDAVRTSLLNLHGADHVSIPKVAITMDDLLAIRRQLDTRYFEHARDWCACLIAFFGLLPIGEYMDAGLRVRHVRPEAASLEITVQYSKTCRSPAQCPSAHAATSSARYAPSSTTAAFSRDWASRPAPTARYSSSDSTPGNTAR